MPRLSVLCACSNLPDSTFNFLHISGCYRQSHARVSECEILRVVAHSVVSYPSSGALDGVFMIHHLSFFSIAHDFDVDL